MPAYSFSFRRASRGSHLRVVSSSSSSSSSGARRRPPPPPRRPGGGAGGAGGGLSNNEGSPPSPSYEDSSFFEGGGGGGGGVATERMRTPVTPAAPPPLPGGRMPGRAAPRPPTTPKRNGMGNPFATRRRLALLGGGALATAGFLVIMNTPTNGDIKYVPPAMSPNNKHMAYVDPATLQVVTTEFGEIFVRLEEDRYLQLWSDDQSTTFMRTVTVYRSNGDTYFSPISKAIMGEDWTDPYPAKTSIRVVNKDANFVDAPMSTIRAIANFAIPPTRGKGVLMEGGRRSFAPLVLRKGKEEELKKEASQFDPYQIAYGPDYDMNDPKTAGTRGGKNAEREMEITLNKFLTANAGDRVKRR